MHDDVNHAAEAPGGGGSPDRWVAGVADEVGVGPQYLGVIRDERLESTGAVLLRP